MDNQRAIELYTLFRQENATWLSSHREHSQQFLTLIAAILGVSIAAVVQLSTIPNLVSNNSWMLGLISVGPFVNVLLCINAIRMCDRSYQAYLECISIQAKLERKIGLIGKRSTSAKDQVLEFPDDKNVVPERWIQTRDFRTTKEFVETYMNRGSNLLVRITFRILALTNGVLFLVLSALWLNLF
jgi:hypothetical protein